jgi:hypothetical protein
VKLLPNWKAVLWRSWSVWLGIAASLLGAIELLLPLFQDWMPRGPFAIASLVLALAVPVARITAQATLHE